MTTHSTELQNWSAEGYAKNARFVADLGGPLFELLAPKPGERILDLGCGDGALTEKLVAAGASVKGFDQAPDLVKAARARGLDVDQGDAHKLPYKAEFDAAFSNAALHWMPRPAEVIAGVARALKPGGRFVGEFGGHGNVAAVVTAMLAVLRRRGVAQAQGPWFFPTTAEYGALLEQGGFAVETIALIPRPTPLPTGMGGWLATFAAPTLSQLPEGERAAAYDEAIDLLAPVLRDRSGNWTADYVRLRFSARLR